MLLKIDSNLWEDVTRAWIVPQLSTLPYSNISRTLPFQHAACDFPGRSFISSTSEYDEKLAATYAQTFSHQQSAMHELQLTSKSDKSKINSRRVKSFGRCDDFCINFEKLSYNYEVQNNVNQDLTGRQSNQAEFINQNYVTYGHPKPADENHYRTRIVNENYSQMSNGYIPNRVVNSSFDYQQHHYMTNTTRLPMQTPFQGGQTYVSDYAPCSAATLSATTRPQSKIRNLPNGGANVQYRNNTSKAKSYVDRNGASHAKVTDGSRKMADKSIDGVTSVNNNMTKSEDGYFRPNKSEKCNCKSNRKNTSAHKLKRNATEVTKEDENRFDNNFHSYFVDEQHQKERPQKPIKTDYKLSETLFDKDDSAFEQAKYFSILNGGQDLSLSVAKHEDDNKCSESITNIEDLRENTRSPSFQAWSSSRAVFVMPPSRFMDEPSYNSTL